MAGAIVVSVSALGSGCAVSCPTALLAGTIVEHQGTLAVESDGERLVQVVWPEGVSVKPEGDYLILADWFGLHRMAAEGDRVEVGGGQDHIDPTRFRACGSMTVRPL